MKFAVKLIDRQKILLNGNKQYGQDDEIFKLIKELKYYRDKAGYPMAKPKIKLITKDAKLWLRQFTTIQFHIHKAVNANRRLYRCTIPGCTYTIPASLLVGRKTRCAECDTEFFS